VFRISTNGTDFQVLKNLSGSDGTYPYAGLVLSGTTLYGTASEGGNYDYGTIFKLETDGTGYSAITHFQGGDGQRPTGDLLLVGTVMYGTTGEGGVSPHGSIYRANTDGSGYAVLKEFTNVLDGVEPNGGLLLSGSNLFGTTRFGGEADNGTVFK